MTVRNLEFLFRPKSVVPELAIVCAPLRDVAGDRRRSWRARHARGDHRAHRCTKS
jgi:hypothetical protein